MIFPRHWLISAGVALPGAVIYRAADSGWFGIDPTASFRIVLMIAGATLAFTGLVLFIMLSHHSRQEKQK